MMNRAMDYDEEIASLYSVKDATFHIKDTINIF
jgi:hypothetical protein